MNRALKRKQQEQLPMPLATAKRRTCLSTLFICNYFAYAKHTQSPGFFSSKSTHTHTRAWCGFNVCGWGCWDIDVCCVDLSMAVVDFNACRNWYRTYISMYIYIFPALGAIKVGHFSVCVGKGAVLAFFLHLTIIIYTSNYHYVICFVSRYGGYLCVCACVFGRMWVWVCVCFSVDKKANATINKLLLFWYPV